MEKYSIYSKLNDSLNFKPKKKLNHVREQFKCQWFEFLEDKGDANSIILNDAPNRIGKSISSLEFYINKIREYNQLNTISKAPRILYLSDRHKQIAEVKNTLLKEFYFDNFNHIMGIDRLCQRREEEAIKSLIEDDVSASAICDKCDLREKCKYHLQFNFKDGYIIGSPKEFLPTRRIQGKNWDYIVLDEVIDKAHKIKPICPIISDETFNSHFLQDYNPFYAMLNGILNDLKQAECTVKYPDSESKSMLAEFQRYKTLLKKRSFNDLKRLTEIIKEDIALINDQMMNIILFINGLSGTFEWLDYSFKYGFRTHFYKPYLHYAFDLSIENHADLIILNTSLERHIYDSLASTYKSSIPEPLEFNHNITNKKSLILHYNHIRKRSCAKWTIFEVYKDEEGKCRILKDKHGYPVTKNYGNEIVYMATEIAAYSKELGKSVGLITFKDAKNVLRGYADVVDHFGGHQGSNKFDDVDVLIILGTYHLPQSARYKNHYIIRNEFLKDNPAKWNNSTEVNGVRINLTDNENFNKVILYKLNEEHSQALFRNSAHVEDCKIVIAFGYVPQGIEEKLDYRKFGSAHGAKISIGKWLKKSKMAK